MAAETLEEALEDGIPPALTEAQFASLMRKGLSDPVLARALGRLGVLEVLFLATVNDVARRHSMAMEQKSRADKFEAQYNELKSHLEMYKEQWKRSIEKDGRQLHEAFKQWKSKHLNDEVEDVAAERDAAIATNEHLRDYLKWIVEYCSYTREEQDPVGQTAKKALSHDTGQGWLSPKQHLRSLKETRFKLEMAAIAALPDAADQHRVTSAMRAVVLKEESE